MALREERLFCRWSQKARSGERLCLPAFSLTRGPVERTVVAQLNSEGDGVKPNDESARGR